MCGIVGYVGPRAAAPIILDGLRRLEYRGYDSVGMAVMSPHGIGLRRAPGKMGALAALLEQAPLNGNMGIGHTRWATHGPPSERNAHPHTDCSGQLVVIHNGIVENYAALREILRAEGHSFRSETDTEVIVHLVESYMAQGHDLLESARLAIHQLQGAHGIVLMSAQEPDRLVAARVGNAGGVVIGCGDGETHLASDIPAILAHAREMIFLEDQQMAVVQGQGVQCQGLDGRNLTPGVHCIPWDRMAADRGGYPHYMLKEIMEQGQTLTDALRGRIDFEESRVRLPDLALDPAVARRFTKAVIVACGTSYHAGLVAKFLLEQLARLPVEVDYASEFRYRDPLVDEKTLAVAITQSGETVDTLAAMEEARTKGAHLLSIVNAIGSQAARVADDVLYMHAGPEIGVASTKAFTSSLVALYLLGVHLGVSRGAIGRTEERELVEAAAALPKLAGKVLAQTGRVEELARLYYRCEDFLYLGRGIQYPIALEGALKLKEISYIHAEGYPAGEMKHGPIALIDEEVPTVALALHGHVYDKMISQVEQVKARKGKVLALITQGDDALAAKADHAIPIPPCHPLLAPVLAVIPLQLLAYHMAVLRGCDVDQPRNLAKSVTVE